MTASGSMLRQDHPYACARENIVPFVPSGTRFLDVGCSSGRFIASLKSARPEAEVWGLEPSESAARSASEVADHVIHGVFPDDLPPDIGKFDAVIFNHVLEHMVDPWEALRRTHGLLAPNGAVVVSLPNARYMGVVLPLLLQGTFTYQEAGHLDRTHLRFFTRSSMRDLLESSGFEVAIQEGLDLVRSWKMTLATLPKPSVGRDMRTQQYVLVGRQTRG